MNETTKSDMIMIMHRLKRLIGSFYHRKRIDIIITGKTEAPYIPIAKARGITAQHDKRHYPMSHEHYRYILK